MQIYYLLNFKAGEELWFFNNFSMGSCLLKKAKSQANL